MHMAKRPLKREKSNKKAPYMEKKVAKRPPIYENNCLGFSRGAQITKYSDKKKHSYSLKQSKIMTIMQANFFEFEIKVQLDLFDY